MAEGEKKHAKIGKINEFCPVKGNSTCKCKNGPGGKGNDYRDVCEPDWAGDYKFAQGITGKSKGTWEAHHVLSVSCVNWYPNEPEKRAALKRVLKETKWCINNVDNMLALPKFGQTIMYYTNIETGVLRRSDIAAPPFAGLPQHDFEHNTPGGYCTEVKQDISDLWYKVAKAAKRHSESKDGIKALLDGLSTKWKNTLLRRGSKRPRGPHAGTHASWMNARENPDSTSKEWYLPFSMANNAHAEERAFTWKKKFNEKLKEIQESLRSARRHS